MTAITLTVARRFRYLWFKSVRAFDPRVHCARSLKGEYHPGLSGGGARARERITLEFDPGAAPFHYLCGVTGRWEDNLHLPMRAKPGAGPITIRHKGIKIEIGGGVEVLPIQDPIPDADKAFGTCRNWLFGLQYFGDSREIAVATTETASSPRP